MVNEDVKRYLSDCGFKSTEINKMDSDTRLYHDLGAYGDIAESYIDLLKKNYRVDVSNFYFYDFFPEEFPGNTWFDGHLYTFIPFLRKRYMKTQNFKPLTLHMIGTAIRIGKLESERKGSDSIDIEK